MSNEEKILEILTQMQTDISDLKTDVSGLKTDVSALKTGQAKLEADVSGIKVLLDLEIPKQLNQLVDGQDSLDRRLSHVEELAQDTKETVDVVKAVISKHGREIIELKQAK